MPSEKFTRSDFAKRQIQSAQLEITGKMIKVVTNTLIAQGVLNKKLLLMTLSALRGGLIEELERETGELKKEIISAQLLMLEMYFAELIEIPELSTEARRELLSAANNIELPNSAKED